MLEGGAHHWERQKGRSERSCSALCDHAVSAYDLTRRRREREREKKTERVETFFFFFFLAEGRKILPARKYVLPVCVCPAEWLLAGVQANTGRHISAGFLASRGTFTADETANLLPTLGSYVIKNNRPTAKLRLEQEGDIIFNRQTA